MNAGYAKFETFPVWNLPLKHPVNLAYEAATADLKDVNMIDPFHLEKYGEVAINYNRDIETFPILKNILARVSHKDIYFSPTDMGVNMVGFCISDENVVEEASKKEIVRRYYNERVNYRMGLCDEDTYKKIKLLMNELNIDEEYLDVVKPALKKKNKEKGLEVIALKVQNKIITGKKTELLTPAGAVILNAVKYLSKIPDDIYLLSPTVLEPILKMKKELGKANCLSLSEVLTALSICSVTNPLAAKAISMVPKLQMCDAHATYVVRGSDKRTLKDLKINLTCEDELLEEEF